MNCSQAQTIPITEYLAWRGYFPVYCHSGGTEYSYHSPVRQGNDKSPSFDVDIIKNVWNDFAWQGSSSTGGDIVKLVCDLESVIVSQALSILDDSGLYNGKQSYVTPYVELRKSTATRSTKRANAYSIHSELGTLDEQKSGLIIESIDLVQHPLLNQYLAYRKIDKSIALNHGLKEINYFHTNDATKKYFALAWQNDDGGYELNRRGMYKTFKGCIGSKNITSLVNSKSNQVAVFEGYLDFLAYLSHFKIEHYQSSVICLNGTGQIDGAIAKIEHLKKTDTQVYLFLDNDEAGAKTSQICQSSPLLQGIEIINKSNLYQGYKDFNDFTMEINSTD